VISIALFHKFVSLQGSRHREPTGVFRFTEPRSIQLTKDVALVTYRADVRGTCDGCPTPPSLWVASFNQKEGGKWKNALYTDVNR
jgi:hypothetical protein